MVEEEQGGRGQEMEDCHGVFALIISGVVCRIVKTLSPCQKGWVGKCDLSWP